MMRDDFNQKTEMSVELADGQMRLIPKNLVRTFYAVKGRDDLTHVVLLNPKALKEAEAIVIREAVDVFMRRLTGEPSAEQKQAWERQVIIERNKNLDQEIARTEQEYQDSRIRIMSDHARDMADIEAEALQIAGKLDHPALKQLDTRSGQMVVRIQENAKARRSPYQVRSSYTRWEIVKVAALGASLLTLAERKDAAQTRQKELEKTRDRFTERQQERLADQDARYERALAYLHNQRSDPQMKDQDKLQLEIIIYDYRREHRAPNFQYARQEKAGEVYYEQRAARKFEHERLREDPLERLGPRRSRGYSISR